MSQASTPPAKSTIHRPSSNYIRYVGLRTAMQLKNNKARFMQATKHIRVLSDKYLDHRLLVSEQSESQWKKFIEELQKADGIFQRYDECWPAKDYLASYHSKARRRQRAEDKLEDDDEDLEDEDEDEETELGDTSSYRPSSVTASEGTSTRSEPAYQRSKTSVSSTTMRTGNSVASFQAKVPSPAFRARSPSPKFKGTAARPPSRQSAARSSVASRMPDFRQFLWGLHPVLGRHYVNFVAGGVDNVDDFIELMQLPKHERASFLRMDCQISKAIQVTIINVALDKVCMEQQYDLVPYM